MAFLFQHKNPQVPQSDNPYWMSFSDMMSGMLIIFILVCIALMYKLSEMEDKVNSNIDELRMSYKIRSDILKEIKTKLEKAEGEEVGIHVIITDNDSVLRIPDGSLSFETGEYKIREKNIDNAKKIGRVLFEAISHDDRRKHLDTIFIEGHTDEQPFINVNENDTEFLGGNWGLSTNRAIWLWKFWISQPEYGEKLKELKNDEGKYLFSVSGYSDTRPVIKGAKKEEQHNVNRRIDIRFTTKQPTILKLEDVIAPLKEK